MLHYIKSKFKHFHKSILANPRTRLIVARLISYYVRFVFITSKWEVIGGQHPEAFWRDGQPFISYFWHNRLMMLCYAWSPQHPVSILTSDHKDGRLISDILHCFNLSTIHGSTGKQGDRAALELVKKMRAGVFTAIVPDGPRGPCYKLQPGIVNIARLSGCPVVPVAYSVKRCIRLRSWDRLIIALPFNRGVFVWGEPLTVAKDSDPVAKAIELERHLQDITEQADRYTHPLSRFGF